jgi:hypothetical protein
LFESADYFETTFYLKKTFKELGLEFTTGTKGIISFLSYSIKLMADGRNVKGYLSDIYGYYGVNESWDEIVYDFYLLNWAWDDLDYGNIYQGYWPAATLENIETIVINKAKEWIEVNKDKFPR